MAAAAVPTMTHHLFPPDAERLLHHIPPNYDAERHQIFMRMISTVGLFIFLIPFAIRGVMQRRLDAKLKQKEEEDLKRRKKDDDAASDNGGSTTKKGKKKEKKPTTSAVDADKASDTRTDENEAAPKTASLPWYAMPLLNTLCLFSLFTLLLTSSNNRYTPRAIFEVPLFTTDECSTLIQMSHDAAMKRIEQLREENPPPKAATSQYNVEFATKARKEWDEEHSYLLHEPIGWNKNRDPTDESNPKGIHPIMSLHRLGKKGESFVRDRVKSRLVPVLERLYGVAPDAMRLEQVEMIRYDASLPPSTYTDLRTEFDYDLHFSIPLNIDYDGDGTRFYDRSSQRTVDVHPHESGIGLIHSGSLTFSERPVAGGGVRYLLVGDVDFDPTNDHGEYTGLSRFASWGSLDWLLARSVYHWSRDGTKHAAKDGSIWFTIRRYLEWFVDRWPPHFHAHLVAKGDREEFLNVLDVAAARRPQSASGWGARVSLEHESAKRRAEEGPKKDRGAAAAQRDEL